MEIVRNTFGVLPDGRQVELFSLKTRGGMQADLMTYGAALVQLLTPLRDGGRRDVVLGYDTLDGYLQGDSYQGAVVGRYANRIAGGSYTRGEKTFALTKNEKGVNTLHGGENGFSRKLWSVSDMQEGEASSVTFFYRSTDGEEGFPGNLDVWVRYTLQEDNTLAIDYRAAADQETPVNLTNHAYFNLAGGGTIEGHILQMDAPWFTPADENGIPTGEIRPVTGTPMDFTKPKPIGQDIAAVYPPLQTAKGYDHNYVLEKRDGCARFAELYDPDSGLTMEVSTDLPGVQLYTAQFLNPKEIGKGEKPLVPRGAVCLETQYFPDSVHHSHFPSPFVRPEEEFRAYTCYRFYNR